MAQPNIIDFEGHKIDIANSVVIREKLDLTKTGDYGADPIGDGRFRMVPSGDIVDYSERKKRLGE